MNLSHEDASLLWTDVLGMVNSLEDTSIVPWIERLSPLSLEDGVMLVTTGQNWTARKVMGDYRTTIESILQEITMEPISLNVVVGEQKALSPTPSPTPSAAASAPAVSATTPAAAAPAPSAHAATVRNASSMGGRTSTQQAPETAGNIEDSPMFHVKHSQDSQGSISEASYKTTGEMACSADVSPETIEGQTGFSQKGMSPAALAGADVAAGRPFFTNKATVAPWNTIPSPRATTPAAPETGRSEDVERTSNPDSTPGTGVEARNAGDSLSGATGVVAASGDPCGIIDASCADPSSADFETLAAPEIVPQNAVIPILEDGGVPKEAVKTGYSDFVFDTYVVGDSNSIAYHMALAIAEQPDSIANPNPLFIWSSSGNGKTHLLLSILNYMRDHHPALNVQYVPALAFVNQFMDDLHTKKLHGNEILKAYRAVDVLLVDDVQHFESKQDSVTIFFDIFNALILSGKRIVLAADVAPDYLSLDERMRTRFNSGAVIDIKAPTYEMKHNILVSYFDRCRSKLGLEDIDLPSKSLDLMVQLAPNNPRSMQGLVTTLLFAASTDDPTVLAPDRIKDFIKNHYRSSNAITLSSILHAVSDSYGVTIEDIKGKSRTKAISEARQVTMWIARQLTDESYETIGSELGGRDHSTVYYGISTVEKRILDDRSYFHKLERLKKEISD